VHAGLLRSNQIYISSIPITSTVSSKKDVMSFLSFQLNMKCSMPHIILILILHDIHNFIGTF
jgi:ABC-type methionine transport system permease subunit